MPVGGINGQQGVGGVQLPSMREIAAKFVEGAKAIGSKLCEFGASAAAFLKGIGRSIRDALPCFGAPAATAPVVIAKVFTDVEKQEHMRQALESDFYKACASSTTAYITQDEFEGIARAILSTPAAVSAMKTHPVTLDEAVAISMYTSQNFRAINEALRTNAGKPEIDALAAAFTSGLSKLPSFSGNPVTGPDGRTYHQVFRGARLPEDVGNRHMIGQTVSDRGILSSTYDSGQKFTDRVNFDMVLLLKPGSAGKDITMFSDKPTECEVAFPPGVAFQVVDRRLDTNGMLSPDMERTYHPKLDDFGRPALGACTLVMRET